MTYAGYDADVSEQKLQHYIILYILTQSYDRNLSKLFDRYTWMISNNCFFFIVYTILTQ